MKFVIHDCQIKLQKMKKMFFAAAFVMAIMFPAVYAEASTGDLRHAPSMSGTSSVMMSALSDDGSYTKTGQTVSVYTETGHSKGSYAVYLHDGKRYIKFYNTWICIQGKSRFAYNGNWYVIK